MRTIQAVVIEPVGCLAEFPAEQFQAVTSEVFALDPDPSQSGSEAYWSLLELMDQAADTLERSEKASIERAELDAVERAHLYEDVAPALAELRSMGITLLVASSLSAPAVARFLDKFSLTQFFSGVWTRDNSDGVKIAPLTKAMASLSVEPAHVMALVDTPDSMAIAKEAGANSILLFNDYDEGKRLAAHDPTGAIVSLHELPDAIRFVAEQAKTHS